MHRMGRREFFGNMSAFVSISAESHAPGPELPQNPGIPNRAGATLSATGCAVNSRLQNFNRFQQSRAGRAGSARNARARIRRRADAAVQAKGSTMSKQPRAARPKTCGPPVHLETGRGV
jgi:hypothetical protein